MTGLLASVRSAGEATIAVRAGADIIDAKEPAAGALGRVAPTELRAIVREVAGRCQVSATIGDMELSPDAVVAAVEATAAAGADIVKVGVFSGDLAATWAALHPLAHHGVKLVAVMFADRSPDLCEIPALCARSGFLGAMLDTADNSTGPLTAHLAVDALAAFIAYAKRLGLLTGLAGSLRLDDIPGVVAAGADYLGFRSALTRAGRAGGIDEGALRRVRQALDAADASRARSRATATAGATSDASARSSGFAAATISPNSR